MARDARSTIVVAAISALSAVAIALITTYGTIAVSAPKVRQVKEGLQTISASASQVEDAQQRLQAVSAGVQDMQRELKGLSASVRDAKQELQGLPDLARIANLPIGAIVPSMLPPSLFAREVGDPSVFDPEKSKWVLADSRQDITLSRYGQLLGNTARTPDLRGMFLRGMNVEGGADPDVRKAGVPQQDALQEHGHATTATGFNWSDPSTNYGYTSTGGAHAPTASVTTVTGATTAGETRPKNVAAYFYIKIN